ncbi:hypothetical protein JOC86_000582 [Bacillus pakistanensis]|uniref:Spore germination protein n=2 Tax=Rossellomorea pakistanensis TaxID=992288 RepID=A0ABS2N861_9BACI|nr:hypothetical protein [Bacillus pakistanensis]
MKKLIPRKHKTLRENKLFEEFISIMRQSDDFIEYFEPQSPKPYRVFYLATLVKKDVLHQDILPYLNREELDSLEDIKVEIPLDNIKITEDLQIVKQQLLQGSVIVQLDHIKTKFAIIPAHQNKGRQISIPEVEFSVVGPKEAFVEDLDTNLQLIRRRLPISELQVKELVVGDLSKTRIAILSIEGISDQENVNTLIQRISDIHIDQINDSSYITQLIQDNNNSPFPQFIDTERPDRIAAVLSEGKVAILVNGAPHGLIGPTTFIEFFSAFEDYFLNWIIASFFRLVRLFAVLFSILVTPLYVAVLTYHYVLIPQDLVSTLVTSRRTIPLPPILEAIILELAIELLREAGARLPTKVGQTIGIVGGIVIGTASVEAGLTSNVLLIIVALAALASFTTPVYQMGNTIRLLRFPILLMAHIWGLLGVAICFCFILIHLLRLTSLGRPFLEPLFPLRISDFTDAFIRLPFKFQAKRPLEVRSQEKIRFNPKRTEKLKDIDEL